MDKQEEYDMGGNQRTLVCIDSKKMTVSVYYVIDKKPVKVAINLIPSDNYTQKRGSKVISPK